MERKTGVTIPLSALLTKKNFAIGEFTALKPFADFCTQSGLSIIQLLPVNDTGTQSSPYSGLSAFALHPIYIDISSLPEFTVVMEKDKTFAGAYHSYEKEFKIPVKSSIRNTPDGKNIFFESHRFDYNKVLNRKIRLLHLMYAWIEKQVFAEAKKNSKNNNSRTNIVTAVNNLSFAQKFILQTDKFVNENRWVIPYAVFKNLKDTTMQASWKEWPENLRSLSRDQIMLRWNNRALRSSHNFFVWCQMRAAEQFKDSSDYIKSQNIILKGDIPILMNDDSSDTWAWPEYFNHQLRAGSPPDNSNLLGQNWGFPTYNWDLLSVDNYSWWKDRISSVAKYYSAFRIDHVLGFFRIWATDQNESNAYLGHTIPFLTITRKELNLLGFDDSRIRWLSKPHIPTQLAEDITWNREEAHRVLSLVADRINNEELWLFKDSISTDKNIYNTTFFTDDDEKNKRLQDELAKKWRDRTLIEIEKNCFIKVWSYKDSTSWCSLSEQEKSILLEFFTDVSVKENLLWKKQGTTLLTAITSCSDMTACAEDLGAVSDCVPEVLKKLGILSLRVVRWCRSWNKDNQPFVPFSEYPDLSVCTTSVHDSPTLRQWWCDEKESVCSYLKLWDKDSDDVLFENLAPVKSDDEFSSEVASFCLGSAAGSSSCWYINPLQDYLYLNQMYFLEDKNNERINVPGTVDTFNWTYRIPVTIEQLSSDKILINSIRSIVKIHECKNIGGKK